MSIGLSGRGLQQSPEQWDERGRVLTEAMSALVSAYLLNGARAGLDVGCQNGGLVDELAARTGLVWQGVDPRIEVERRSPAGARLIHGYADQLAYPDQSLDVLLFANVFEHVLPERRSASLLEMARVLRPEGLVVGQIPNPYFLIESHSRLPLMGTLPIGLQRKYWRLSNVPWGHDFYSVTRKHLLAAARPAGFSLVEFRRFNYPVEVYPTAVQPMVRLLGPLMRVYPWAWQFVLRKG